MLDQMVYVAAVTVLGVLEQAYFSLQVIYARRKYSVPPPSIAGPPEFERVYRAQVNCAEYFPLFVSMLWVASLYFSQVVAPLCGLLYLYGRYQYFHGYAQSSQGRLAPMYFSARVLWLLIGFSTVGVLSDLSKIFFRSGFSSGPESLPPIVLDPILGGLGACEPLFSSCSPVLPCTSN